MVDLFFLYVIFRDIVLFMWHIVRMLRLEIPFAYVIIMATVFNDFTNAHETIVVAILLIMLAMVALSWICTFIVKVKIIVDSINNKM